MFREKGTKNINIKTEVYECARHLEGLQEAGYYMITKGCRISVREEAEYKGRGQIIKGFVCTELINLKFYPVKYG